MYSSELNKEPRLVYDAEIIHYIFTCIKFLGGRQGPRMHHYTSSICYIVVKIKNQDKPYLQLLVKIDR